MATEPPIKLKTFPILVEEDVQETFDDLAKRVAEGGLAGLAYVLVHKDGSSCTRASASIKRDSMQSAIFDLLMDYHKNPRE